MEKLTSELLNNDSIAVGKALAQAKRLYHLQERRWDVFDEKVLHELTLFGIPNYLLVGRQTRGQGNQAEGLRLKAEGVNKGNRGQGSEDQGLRTKDQGRGAEEELPLPDGPAKGCADGICLEKYFTPTEGVLPPGVTELNLHFTFCSGALSTCTCPPQSYPNCTYQLVTAATGQYYKLNNRASGEVGAAIQPHFVYNSYLSGTLAHGVLFTGGGYECETPFTPVVAAPASTAYTPSAGPNAPAGGMFTPNVRASFGTAGGLGLRATGRALGQVGYTNLTVHTGFYTGAIPTGSECRFGDMEFVHYYSNAADALSPVVADPGAGFHLLT
ncbi:MAG TPA: hypothetical protein VJ565_02770, partial [Dehalococcoidia bacterium]|nr:hypothetical protein [Dehalococcoidia bacterium]